MGQFNSHPHGGDERSLVPRPWKRVRLGSWLGQAEIRRKMSALWGLEQRVYFHEC